MESELISDHTAIRPTKAAKHGLIKMATVARALPDSTRGRVDGTNSCWSRARLYGLKNSFATEIATHWRSSMNDPAEAGSFNDVRKHS